MSKHTRGPWSYDQRLIYDNSPYGPLATVHRNQADAARIVACVNACEGMDDPAAEIARLREHATGWMRKAGDAEKAARANPDGAGWLNLIAERDEALEALREVRAARRACDENEEAVTTSQLEDLLMRVEIAEEAADRILRKHGRLD